MLDPARLVFIDETAVSTNLARVRGRAPKGDRVIGTVPLGAWETITFVAALPGLSGFPCVSGRLNVTPPWP